MKFNLITKLYTMYQIKEDVDDPDTPVEPDTPVTPDEPDKPDVPTKVEKLFTGFLPTDTITASEIPNLQIAITIDEDSEIVSYPSTKEGYIWFCSTKRIQSIVDPYRFPVDHIFYSEISAKINDEEKVFYCYRTTYDLVANNWVFTINY